MPGLLGTPIGVTRFPVPLSAIAVLLALLALLAASCADETLTLEQRAQAIDQRLMCPVCPAETIDQSQADVAIQMRDLVREKLEAGESEEAIFAFFVERYDKAVLAEPPAEGFNVLVWVIPPVVFVLGLLLVWAGIRQLGRGDQRITLGSDAAPVAESERYLSEVDEELDEFRRAAAPGRGG